MLITISRPARSRSRVWAVTAAAALLLVGGCSEERMPPAAPSSSPEPSTTTTSLADFDPSGAPLARAAFCDRVSEESLAAALGGEPTESKSWAPGDRLPGTKDISSEFGCAWTAGPVTARAWVFAPPITRQRAGDFAAETVGTKCRRLRSAPSLGAPGVAQTCGLNAGADLVGFYGLVGDAWVGCEVSDADDVARVDEWCVGILTAMRAD